MPVQDDTSCCALKASEFAKIRQLAYDTFGLDLRAGKETLVSTRLGKQIRHCGCKSFDEYYHYVVADSTGESLVNLIDALTTNHTSFFREVAHFDFLRKTFLPQWKNRGSFGVWSAACSTGEEPYSIAMCILGELGASAPGKARILASDISTRVLAKAEQGIYSAERLENLPGTQLRRYWLRGEGNWAGYYRVKKEVRALVEFRRLNLVDPASQIGCFPLIFCRNVMIYFDKPTQQRVVERLVECQEPGGYLLTGHAETLPGIDHGLRYVQPAVYRKGSSDGRQKGMVSLLTVGVGDCKVSNGVESVLATYALGSCIAIAIHDPLAAVGGLLHFMLPESSLNRDKAGQNPFMFADTGIPLLFHAAYELGADKRRLVVRAVGGAQVMDENGVFNIGKRNQLAMRKILWKAGVMIHGEEIGGTMSRTVRLEVASGRFWIRGPGTADRELPASATGRGGR